MPKSRLHVVLRNAPTGIDELVLVFSGPQKIEKRLETSPGATPSDVTFELPTGLYAVLAWYRRGSVVYLLDEPASLNLKAPAELALDLSKAHPDDIEGGTL